MTRTTSMRVGMLLSVLVLAAGCGDDASDAVGNGMGTNGSTVVGTEDVEGTGGSVTSGVADESDVTIGEGSDVTQGVEEP